MEPNNDFYPRSPAPFEQVELPTLLLEAIDYLRLFHQEQLLPESQLQKRLAEIHQDYRRSRT